MSHNYPYRMAPEDFRSHQGAFSTSDRLHHEERDIYQTSLQPSSRSTSVFTSSKSALASYSSQSSTTTNNALSLLSSCGLEPEDLSVLAGMPEHMITEETLPRLLIEIRQKKALRDASGPSSHRHSTSHQSLQPQSNKWENSSHSSPAEYPVNPPQCSYPQNAPQHSYPPIPPPRSTYPVPREETESWKDRWGNPKQTGAARQEKNSSTYVVDYNYGQPQDGDSQNHERPTYSVRPVGSREHPHLPSLSNYRPLNPGKEPAASFQKKPILPQATTVHSTPTATEANDFHGATPKTFPYACSLCDIAVLSQKDWNLHINGAQHADSQLAVLQMYPDWDCRTGSARQSDYHSEKGREEKKTGRRHGTPLHSGVTSSCEGQSYPSGDKAGGRVVCARYAANSMDERSLRKLVGRVGTAVNVMMFPVQGFIEMSSPDEAEDVVQYFSRNQVVVQGVPVEFSMSATYNFLQNSPVVCFSLLPPGNEKYPEIVAIAKRFGSVKHSLFLPNRVLLEMGSREDAGKLVQYYTSHPLKMKSKIIQVSHSTEHSTLRLFKTDKESEDGEASRHSGQSCRSQIGSFSGSRRSPSPRRSPNMRKRHCSPRRRSSSPRRSPSLRRRSPNLGRSSYSPRRRSSSLRRRSPGTGSRSPIQKKRSPGKGRRSHSPRGKSRVKRDVTHRVDNKAQERTRSCSRHGSRSSGKSASHTREDESASRGHSEEKTANTRKAGGKGNGVLSETPDLRSSQEPSCAHSQTEENVPSPNEHPKEYGVGPETQDQTGKGGEEEKDSDMESDIEGMAVIGEDEELRSEEGSMEFLEAMEEDVCGEAGIERTSAEDLTTFPSEVAAAGEEEKTVEAEVEELVVLPVKAVGSQSHTADPAMSELTGVKAVWEEKQDGQEEVEEPKEADEEVEPDFPESLEHCITLDELEDEDDECQAFASEGNSDQRSREEQEDNSERVIYIQNLPSGYYTDKQFVAIGKQYGKVNRYFLIRCRKEGFIEMERSADAQRAVRELSKKCVTMDRCILVVHLSQKYKRLTSGWRPESDSEDEGEQGKYRTEKMKGEQENCSSREKSGKEREPSNKKFCIREEKTTLAEPSSSIKEEEQAAIEELSSNREEEQQQEEEKKAGTEEPSSNREQQQQEEEGKGTSEMPSEQEELVLKMKNEDPKINLPSNSMETQKDANWETCSENPDGIKQVSTEEEKVEMIMEPTHVPMGPYLPNNPMGREFVSQKIGYFCSLCNAIYITEDEAIHEHCSSLTHYEKLKAHLEQNGSSDKF